MTTAHEVALELRKLADALDKEPTANIQPIAVYFWHHTTAEESRESFLNLAKILPRPLQKVFSEKEIRLVSDNKACRLVVGADRTSVCRIITPARPAVYDCDPLLSPEEEAYLSEVAE